MDSDGVLGVRTMAGVMVTQGRELRAADIDLIQGLMAEHPDWDRTRLSDCTLPAVGLAQRPGPTSRIWRPARCC